jgi:monoamine oxidase
MIKKITILGAGLSGLLTAVRLQNQGFEIEIIEARNRLGGRIQTVKSTTEAVEMGATWFNDVHANFKNLLQELNLEYYEQFMQGTSYFETFAAAPAQEIEIPNNSPSYRIVGGSSQLIKTLHDKLTDTPIHFDQVVAQLDFTNPQITIQTQDHQYKTDFIISTLPQALFFSDITVLPALPTELTTTALKTHTWMQDSIKVAFVYDNPFWRNNMLSGTLFSNVGPITEFYDQCDASLQTFALCGFVSSGMESYAPQ